jgi:hypothetical protein
MKIWRAGAAPRHFIVQRPHRGPLLASEAVVLHRPAVVLLQLARAARFASERSVFPALLSFPARTFFFFFFFSFAKIELCLL